jgi:hypothetical protein
MKVDGYSFEISYRVGVLVTRSDMGNVVHTIESLGIRDFSTKDQALEHIEKEDPARAYCIIEFYRPGRD